nr:hypothetical protein [Anaerolineae bacterium]
MEASIEALSEAIIKWRGKDVKDYWVSVAYMGAAVNRFGDHTISCIDGKLHHLWMGDWRELKTGSDFWLFSVPGALAWARDMLRKVEPGDEMLEIRFNDEYGYVEYMRMKAERRDTHNFTFEVRYFAEGPHPEFGEAGS